ncbi:MAG TPA: hypothetical protein PK971_08595, partial [Saprospiraceae bacterium]|nr:hypothetical protein [Saprospiraceae bacterium]
KEPRQKRQEALSCECAFHVFEKLEVKRELEKCLATCHMGVKKILTGQHNAATANILSEYSLVPEQGIALCHEIKIS